MKVCIKEKYIAFSRVYPRLTQWLWFVGLWCFGLLVVLIIAYPIKLLIKFIS
jgi:hypothetical protein